MELRRQGWCILPLNEERFGTPESPKSQDLFVGQMFEKLFLQKQNHIHRPWIFRLSGRTKSILYTWYVRCYVPLFLVYNIQYMVLCPTVYNITTLYYLALFLSPALSSGQWFLRYNYQSRLVALPFIFYGWGILGIRDDLFRGYTWAMSKTLI